MPTTASEIGFSQTPIQSTTKHGLFHTLSARILPVLLLAGLGAGVATAQSRLSVDPAQSSVHFSLGDTLHQFGGTFSVSSGNIQFDRATGTMSGQIVVDAASGNSGSAARDKRMKNDELKVKRFPTVIFQPSSFTGTLADSGTSEIQVSGNFILDGTPHPLTVPMTVQIADGICTTAGTFMVPYIAWGLKDPSMFLVKMQRQVKINLTLRGRISRETAHAG